MSIQKKSLISTLKTAKKANVAAAVTHEDAKGEKVASMRLVNTKSYNAKGALSTKSVQAKGISSLKGANLKSLKSTQLKSAKANYLKVV